MHAGPHRRRRVLLVVAGIVVLVAVGSVIVVWRAENPGPASMQDALDRFREADEPAVGEAVERPPEGVYLYAGAGREHISFPPLTQRDGASMPGTVTHRARGCWTFRLDYNANHWQDWRYCNRAGVVVEAGGRTGQEWDLGPTSVSNLSTFDCEPPNPVLPAPEEAGDEVEQACTGTNSSIDGETISAGTWRFVGAEALTIGGEEVDTVHFRGDRTITGAQDGQEATDVWFRADGLLVRFERAFDVRSDSPIGAITYTESGHLLLTDLEPQR